MAVEVGVHVDTARTWRGRFADLGPPGLADRKRPGQPPLPPRCKLRRSRRRPAGFRPRPTRRRPAGRARSRPARPRRAWHRALPASIAERAATEPGAA
ncbi:hypothetical protein N4G66_21860 [Streptomyces rhizosphaerihabitans]|uniref:hypothetical protein n=1 Tax=Streptomyces rhizosphaerihabitans TaxID=1266770 RepID=UPI0021C0C2C5|nr:hypothetical protein [Streptomyces rhizosphaerihabitans]MCT9007481.1 hypothetical protein [Streptomyces rhizosphaerihabitans]